MNTRAVFHAVDILKSFKSGKLAQIGNNNNFNTAIGLPSLFCIVGLCGFCLTKTRCANA